jgi:murein DD-endopeptidase MepM/ murein hydrolase activator NlpD
MAATTSTRSALRRFVLAAGIALAAIGLLGAEVAPLRRLAVPVDGVRIADLRDAFVDRRGGHRDAAIDIAAPPGTAVLAADDGTVVEILRSSSGALTIHQLDPDRRYAYSYAHLDRRADGIGEGRRVRRGDAHGYVGTDANPPPDSPHLRFAVVRLGADKDWRRGEAVDPFEAFE